MTNEDKWMLPDGVDELLPDRAMIAEKVRRNVLDLFEVWGYQLIMPPLIEFCDSYLSGSGKDLDLQTFRLTDQLSGKPMVVRADITPQTARIDAHSLSSKKVRRLCYSETVLHAHPENLFSSRCPIKIGAELFGDASLNADIEVISLLFEMLNEVQRTCNDDTLLSINTLTLDLGHAEINRSARKFLIQTLPNLESNLVDEIFSAIQNKSISDLKLLVSNFEDRKDLVELLFELPKLCGSIDVLEDAKKVLKPLGQSVLDSLVELEKVADVISKRFPDLKIYFDLSEIHGFEYHSGVVFEAYAAGRGIPLANGGRYENIGTIFGTPRTATGFNTDIKSLIDFIILNKLNVEDSYSRDIISAPYDDDPSLWQTVSSLRENGEIVIFDGESGCEKASHFLIKKNDRWTKIKI